MNEFDHLIGQNWVQAAASGYDVRPVIINNVAVFVTQDYHPNRINVEVDSLGMIIRVLARG